MFHTAIPETITLKVHHQYFVSTEDHISLHIVTNISPSLKAQILVFTTCNADSSSFPPSHLGALHICFLMKIEGQPKEALALVGPTNTMLVSW